LAPGYLEDDSVGHMAEYLEGEKPTDFLGQGKVLPRVRTLFFENFV